MALKRVPTEILSYIFGLVTEDNICPPSVDDPIGAVITREVAMRPYNLRVCRSWRQTLMRTSICWRNILIFIRSGTSAENDDRGPFATRLARCGQHCGIRVHITFSEWDTKQHALKRLGNAYSHRIIGLELSRQHPDTIIPLHDHALILLDKSFPRLRYASVWDEWYRDEPNNQLRPILRSCRHLEVFRELNSADFTPRTVQPDLKNVTTVVLVGTCNVRLHGLIRACPKLEQLYIEDHQFVEGPDHDLEPITAARLTTLRIERAVHRAQYIPVPRGNPASFILFKGISLPRLAGADFNIDGTGTSIRPFLREHGKPVSNLTMRGSYSSLRKALRTLDPTKVPVLRTLKLNMNVDGNVVSSLDSSLMRAAVKCVPLGTIIDVVVCNNASLPDQYV